MLTTQILSGPLIEHGRCCSQEKPAVASGSHLFSQSSLTTVVIALTGRSLNQATVGAIERLHETLRFAGG
jgi:hypothetical protein